MKADHPGNWRWGWSRVVLVLLLLVLVMLSGGCFSKPKPATQDLPGKTAKGRRPLLYDRELSQVLVYYLTQDGAYLVPVTVTFNPTREVAKVAVEKLLAGPQVDGLKGVMPDGVKLRDVYLLDNQQTVYVDLTKELLQMKDNGQAERAIKAMVLTLTSLDNARYVQVLVEGQAVPEIGGVKLDTPLARPATINSLLKKDNQQGVQVYFNDASANFLVPVTVALPPGATGSDLPRAAILALLAGPPPDSRLVRTIWPGTRLLDLKIEHGLATVNFSREVTGYGGGSAAETALLNSLLFTLTQFPEINRVQLLIEGQKREYLPEGSAIDKPLSRPEQLNFLKH
ncbi:GerMN domain [Moorella glycerini]|uniref:Spore germination protein GerM n=1 Tax=Neomoorella stamsii TaxID=1266720 RepID=A0A9X7J364_9FIRM|nr:MULTISPECIES: GerMN domain-containing protein [Moorella]PRR73079.1 Spore germination protein GerM [Moorella stamsii]CEP67717.1 GerMN domain [Moorella glycerini]